MNVVALIPARSGSKSVKDKNIRILNGKPMIAYSIEQALHSRYINRVIVSTDSEEYAAIARNYGAETPFIRPKEISGDSSLDIEVFQHAQNWLSTKENYQVDIFVHLRPTHPIRRVEDIDAMIELMFRHPDTTAVRSVTAAKEIPYKMWFMDKNSQLSPIVEDSLIKEAYNKPRQSLPQVYYQNACIDIIKASVIENNSMTGDKIMGYYMDYIFDIDTEEDLIAAEKYLLIQSILANKKTLKIVCDIDGVIAMKTFNNDYSVAKPIKSNIEIINRLYREGHRIVLFTARGYASGINWEQTTEKQMKEWGVLYNELVFGKPDADIYIDDKFMELYALESI